MGVLDAHGTHGVPKLLYIELALSLLIQCFSDPTDRRLSTVHCGPLCSAHRQCGASLLIAFRRHAADGSQWVAMAVAHSEHESRFDSLILNHAVTILPPAGQVPPAPCRKDWELETVQPPFCPRIQPISNVRITMVPFKEFREHGIVASLASSSSSSTSFSAGGEDASDEPEIEKDGLGILRWRCAWSTIRMSPRRAVVERHCGRFLKVQKFPSHKHKPAGTLGSVQNLRGVAGDYQPPKTPHHQKLMG
ncbi:hypothetical protein B0H13DRAFT_1894312 [Mycena leptocephala]|nr:hypothetical protein B0H13DRAFT_1894312 [Mycena leptocephala]